jgi:chaperonin GroES
VNVRPLHDFVLVEYDDSPKTTKGGIHIPDTAKKRPEVGKVIAIGPGRLTEGGILDEVSCMVGQVVLFDKFAGTEIPGETGDKKRWVLLRDKDIYAVIED